MLKVLILKSCLFKMHNDMERERKKDLTAGSLHTQALETICGGPAWNQEPGIASGSLTWVTSILGPNGGFPCRLAGIWIKSETAEAGTVPLKWYVSVARGDWTQNSGSWPQNNFLLMPWLSFKFLILEYTLAVFLPCLVLVENRLAICFPWIYKPTQDKSRNWWAQRSSLSS